MTRRAFALIWLFGKPPQPSIPATFLVADAVKVEKNPAIHLIAASPYKGVEEKWSTYWQQAYKELLTVADTVEYICSGYRVGVFQTRNEWMVDRSARVIAVFNGNPGGTKNTIAYAKRKGVAVIMFKRKSYDDGKL